MSTAGAGTHAAHAAQPVLELRDIVKDFPGVRALDGVSFDLAPGEIHALCGENGAGKSTLIKILCGLFPAGSYSGDMHLHGRPVRFRNVRAAEDHGIVLIAQELALAPGLSIEENIVLGREPARSGLVDHQRMRATAQAALARVGLALDPAAPVGRLGIAQQQMVEIAKAMAKRAAILVLDEPTAALGGGDVARLLALLRELRAQGVASILVSHRLDEVFAVADRVTVLRDGRSVASARACEMPRERAIAFMVGREVADLYPRPPVPTGTVQLAVRGWTLGSASGTAPVLGDIDFDLHRGEILGLAGLVGAGRTALLTSLYGAARGPLRGELRLGSRARSRPPFASPAEAMAAGLALVNEDRKRDGIVPEASVCDNLVLSTLGRFARRGILDTAARDVACSDWEGRLRIKTPSLATAIGRLSGGNQQKTIFGRALLTQPSVLLLDEPTRGIDVGAKSEIYALIAELATQGMAILLATSELPELLGLSHRILVLAQGRQAAMLDGAGATAEAVMQAATTSAGPARARSGSA